MKPRGRGSLLLAALLAGACTRAEEPRSVDAAAREAAPVSPTSEPTPSEPTPSEPTPAPSPLPYVAGTLVLEASCGKRPRLCAPGQDIGVRVASTTVDGVLYVFVVEDPGRSLFAGPLVVHAGEPLILPVAMLAEQHERQIHLEGVVFPRPLEPEEVERARAGEPLTGAVSKLTIELNDPSHRAN